MYFEIAMASAVALFFVYGLICAVRTLLSWVDGERRISVAVEVMTAQDAEELDMLLGTAAASSRRGVRLTVLLSSDLMHGTVGEGEELFAPYAAILNDWGAECYLIDL